MKGYETVQETGSPESIFGDRMRSCGATLEGNPVLDGRWHRTPVESDTGKKMSGTYRGFTDGCPNCTFQNKKTGETFQWKSWDKSETRSQRRFTQSHDFKKEREAAAKTAYGVWSNVYEWANESNSRYLKAKDVAGYGIKLDRDGKVLIPVCDVEGRLHSLQFIGDEKMFLRGGQTSGMMHLIDPKHKIGEQDKIVIAEGYATAASVYEISKLPVAVAFNATNLERVAKALQETYPRAKFIIAADNDHKSKQQGNIGLVSAEQAAKAVDGRVMAPQFTEDEKSLGLTDWNDMHTHRGLDATRQAMRAALKRGGRSREALKAARSEASRSEKNQKRVSEEPEMGMGL